MRANEPSRRRTEHDTLGPMEVPSNALYGAQTARAVDNFPISGWVLPSSFLRALAAIKAAFARAHGEIGLLPHNHAAVIAACAAEVVNGEHMEHFPVDVFQTGSGTSTNMNMNEVLAHLANSRLGGDPAKKRPVHPNDHVNLGQSSNDVIPAALRLASWQGCRDRLRPALSTAATELERLAEGDRSTVTLGRTHLMDAVPTTYGRIFDHWARRLDAAAARIEATAGELCELPLGGTAVGTGIGADARAVELAVAALGEEVGTDFFAAPNPAAHIAAQDPVINHADAIAGAARVLLAVANDLRLRGSGPFGGLGELVLPAVQPGSSIMPGKVNPVIPEAVAQAAIQVEGLASSCRATVSLHQLDLSHCNPLLAWNLDAMTTLVANSAATLATRCLSGLSVNRDHARANAEASPAMATALAGRIGYDAASEVAKTAEREGRPVSATARKLGVLPDDELDELLDVDRIAGAGTEGSGEDT
ncbi:MAG: lyase family protein [Thermoanaerobaculales bacterium]|jgi:fumarate hydratase class II|nr:lyase family protein [Thermoanaerobaculales bacterium]